MAIRPKLEVAHIFKEYRDLLGPLPGNVAKVVGNIIDCRTKVLGGHVRQCESCEHQEHSYNSCRNRHCPKCQFLDRVRWIEDRKSELLPVQYFHVVFTAPHKLNGITIWNKKILYNILFRAASETIKEVAESNLKVQVGFTTVLHTWGQKLTEHPHVHMIVPGGGLTKDGKWKPCKEDFFLPLKILSIVFRGKFLDYLDQAYKELKLAGINENLQEYPEFKKILVDAAQENWIVFVKKPFAGPKQVLDYLGNYTHRIAISNYRLIKMENDHVHFQYRDYESGESKIMEVHAKEFMRRFLLHVLPHGFIRLRHYGFLGNRCRKGKIRLLKAILDAKTEKRQEETKDWKELLKKITGRDIDECPLCKGKMIEVMELPNLRKRIDSS